MRIFSKMILQGALFVGPRRPERIVNENETAAMQEAVQFTTRGVKKRTPQGVMGAQGGLLGSISGEVRQRAKGPLGIVSTPLLYGLVMEEGRRPGKARPPEGVLLRWIEVKMGVGEDEAQKIEPALRWSIAKRGIEGKHMFGKTLEEDWPDIEAIFSRYGIRIARELTR